MISMHLHMQDTEPGLSQLKAQAQTLKPTIRLGKSGLTPEFLAAFEEELERRELVKLRFEGFKDERKPLSRQLAEQSSSRLVQQVGYTAVYYRKAKRNAPPVEASDEVVEDSEE